jgi:hypothetical protein
MPFSMVILVKKFICSPPGYDHPPHKVCRLRRALYGLKQAPRAWFSKFSSTIAQTGFVSRPYDSALFIRRSDAGLILLLLYVDDMIITGDDTVSIRNLQQFLSQQFEMKDLGSLSYFLGLEVSSDKMVTISLKQNMLQIFCHKLALPIAKLLIIL